MEEEDIATEELEVDVGIACALVFEVDGLGAFPSCTWGRDDIGTLSFFCSSVKSSPTLDLRTWPVARSTHTLWLDLKQSLKPLADPN